MKNINSNLIVTNETSILSTKEKIEYKLSNGQKRTVYQIPDKDVNSVRSIDTINGSYITVQQLSKSDFTITNGTMASANNSTFILITITLPYEETKKYDRITFAKLTMKIAEASNSRCEIWSAVPSGTGFVNLNVVDRFAPNDGEISFNLVNAICKNQYSTYYFTIGLQQSEYITVYTQTSEQSLRPTMIVDRIENDDFRKYQTYYQSSLSVGGEYEFNTFSGKLSIKKQLFMINGKKMPTKVNLSYNHEKCGTQNVLGSISTGFPKGWKLNYAQFIVKDGNNYKYVDANYKIHTFLPTSNSNYYYESSGSRILLCKDETGFRIYDEIVTVSYFDLSGRLIKISQDVSKTGSVKNTVDTLIEYDGFNRITKITDGSGRVTLLNYNTDVNTITLTKPDGQNIVISMDSNGFLSQIIDEEGRSCLYETNSEGQIYKVQTYKNEQFRFFYALDSKISRIESYSKSDAIISPDPWDEINSVGIEYRPYETAIIANSAPNVFERKEVVSVYTYDVKGESCSSYEQCENSVDYGDNLVNTALQNASSSIVFRSHDDFERFNYSLANSYIRLFNFESGGHLHGYLDSSLNSYIESNSLSVSNVLENGKEYLFSCITQIMQGTILDETAIYQGILLDQNNRTIASFDIAPYISGKQCSLVKFKYNGETSLKVKFTMNKNVAVAVFTNVGITAVRNFPQTDCISVNNGNSVVFEENVHRSWYKLAPLKLRRSGYEDIEMTLTKNDILINQWNYTKDFYNFTFWYNDGKNVILGASNPTLIINNNQYSLEDFCVSTITEKENEILINIVGYNGDYFKDEVQISYRKDSDGNNVSKRFFSGVDELNRKLYEQDGYNLIHDYTYDQYGNIIQNKTYTDESYFKLSESIYSHNGSFIAEEKSRLDSQEIRHNYTHDTLTGNIISEYLGDCVPTGYTYSQNGCDITKVSATSENVDNKNEFVYENGLLTKISHNGFDYELSYDLRNRLQLVKINGENYFAVTYANYSNCDYVTISFANGYSERKIYDVYGRLVVVQVKSSSTYTTVKTYIYCDENASNLTNISDPLSSSITVNGASKLRKSIDGLKLTYYEYDNKGRLNSETTYRNSSEAKTVVTLYDKYDRVSGTNFHFGSQMSSDCMQTANAYIDGDPVIGDRLGESQTTYRSKSWKKTLQYDDYSRISKKITSLSGQQIVEEFTYYEQKDGNVSTGWTDYIKSVKYSKKATSSSDSTHVCTDSFGYDSRGNVSSVTFGQNGYVRYVYDGLNRLVREDNQKFNKTYVYEYDAGGNITCKKIYAYTIGALGSVEQTLTYSYSSGWKDLLVSYNGQSCVYDASGNPTTYKGRTLSWLRGRLLSGYNTNYYGNVEFNYNYDGLRTSKTYYSSGTTYSHDYTLNGDKIYRESYSEDDGSDYWNYYIEYIYTANSLTGFVYDGIPYYYRFNVFGDVAEIYDASNNCVARYAYDAWGNNKVFNPNGTENTSNYFIGNINPFRYRGYYYDKETKLYYLKTRYYDPETGRFINADSFEYMQEQLLQLNGCNLFAYCCNNPIANIDSNGTIGFAALFVFYAVTALVLTVAGSISQSIQDSESIVEKYDNVEFTEEELKNVVNYSENNTLLTTDELQMKYINYLIAEGPDGSYSDWSKAEMLRELKYHIGGAHLFKWDEGLYGRFVHADFEEKQTAKTYFFRFIGDIWGWCY